MLCYTLSFCMVDDLSYPLLIHMLHFRFCLYSPVIAISHLLFRYEFKTNHEEWVKSVKPRLGRGMSERVNAAMNATHDNIKTLYKVRTEMWGAFQHLLKVL